jgi:hypothetical protein
MSPQNTIDLLIVGVAIFMMCAFRWPILFVVALSLTVFLIPWAFYFSGK